ncbi:hypothetical protein DM01DRAFT_1337959 [Hesseltinella vesiculosa]|uniref:Uncharacterized protein n=1 Tax=Hesseltinella vesiculosa TaxID=101127 RepID=A0A1X2GBE4_9FUNG|nr:hypothetical protein DM01DRAFT_1337959 [Hesseltinella vesiculosa]
MTMESEIAFQNRLALAKKRNADREKELQRLKSRGVVSVLNKAFDAQGNVIDPSPSPSTSLKSSSALHRMRSMEDDLAIATDRWTVVHLPPEAQSPTSIHDDFHDAVTTPVNDNDHASLLATIQEAVEPRPSAELLSNGNDSSQLDKASQDMLQHYILLKEIESAKVHQLSNLVRKQDQVIHELENSLQSEWEKTHQPPSPDSASQPLPNSNDDHPDHDHPDQPAAPENPSPALLQQLADLQQKIADLQQQRLTYEQSIGTLQSTLQSSEQQVQELTKELSQLQFQCHDQQDQIDNKMDRLTKQMYTHNQHHPLPALPLPTPTTPNPPSFSAYLPVQLPPPTTALPPVPPFQPRHDPARDSTITLQSRMSMMSASSEATSRYSRVTLPRTTKKKPSAHVLSWPNSNVSPSSPVFGPIGPPPTCPLPPLPPPGSIDQQPHEELSSKVLVEDGQRMPSDEDDERLDPYMPWTTETLKDADHPPSNLLSRRKVSSTLELLLMATPTTDSLIQNDVDIQQDESYLAFAEQLQSSLSVSKEIDQLHVWDNEILEQIRRYHPKSPTHSSASFTTNPSSVLDDDLDRPAPPASVHSKKSNNSSHFYTSNNTFWKGMKKKLRV